MGNLKSGLCISGRAVLIACGGSHRPTSTESGTRAALTEHPDRTPERTLLRAEVRRMVEDRIDRLPDAYRTVFVLRALEEMSVPDVARALGIPSATVRSRFSRARALLRDALAPELEGSLSEAFAFDGARCDRIVANVLTRARAENLLGQTSRTG